MAPKKAPKAPASEVPVSDEVATWRAQKECPECHARPGRDPSTGIEVKGGHLYECQSLAARSARGES